MPLPIVDKPFDCVAMDLATPLLKSAGGHTHILMIIDYTTRYPEAMPLRSILAKVLARELLAILSRVGFPSAILTYQGTSFIGQTLKEMWSLLGIKPL